VQVAPINPSLKPPGTTHLKLKCNGPLSNSGFDFNLRRYIKALVKAEPGLGTSQVGAEYRYTMGKQTEAAVAAAGAERRRIRALSPAQAAAAAAATTAAAATAAAAAGGSRLPPIPGAAAAAAAAAASADDEVRGITDALPHDLSLSSSVAMVGRCRLTLSDRS